MTDQQIPPGAMLRSFLTVASGYVTTWVVFFIIMFGLGFLFFPPFVEFSKLDAEAQKAMLALNPSDAIPHTMFAAMVVLNAVACLGIGWLVARTAPFAPFSHGIFLAVLVFIMYLQIVIADPAPKKWMDVIYMGVLPVSILQGAKWAAR
jgi:hypothetical protein